jgi:nucleoside-diphosphate-sugar epimerase
LVERIVARARAGRLLLVGSGAALIDTTYVTNAAEAVVAAFDRAPEVGGRAFVISNGEPRPVVEILTRICHSAGVPGPRRRVPYGLAWSAGALVDTWWQRRGRRDDPPVTRFLAEQLATAHWFDQRTTREALQWQPAVSLDEGFKDLAGWYAAQSG